MGTALNFSKSFHGFYVSETTYRPWDGRHSTGGNSECEELSLLTYSSQVSGNRRRPWLLVWALVPPACVTLGKILNFSLLRLSHLQIAGHNPH